MKRVTSLFMLFVLAGFAMIIAGCGGGGSSLTSVTNSAQRAADDYVVYGSSGTARMANSGTSSDELMVLPSGVTAPTGFSPVSGATVQFTDADGNIITLTTDANGGFNVTDIADSSKSSDKDKGKAILQAAQTDISQQPSITVFPPATGAFKDNKPGNMDIPCDQNVAATTDIVSVKIVPEAKKVLTGKKIVLSAVAIDVNGRVVKPTQTVTWSATSGACASPANKSFVCVYTTPATAGTVTITATTKTSADGTALTGKSVLDVIDASSLFTLTGKIFKTDGTTGWEGSVVNFDVSNSAGEAPVHIPVMAKTGGDFSATLPPGVTFSVWIGSPNTGDAKPTLFKSSPASYTTGASGGSGTQNFTALTDSYKPPAAPPPLEQYITGAFWNLRDATEKSIMDTESGIAEVVFVETGASGTVSNGNLLRNWTWKRSGADSAPVWTFVEPVPPAPTTIVPHNKIVISSDTAITKINPASASAVPLTAAGTLKFITYFNKDGDVRVNNGLVTSSGSWTDNLTLTPVSGSGGVVAAREAYQSVDMTITGTINGTVNYFTPDKQSAPQNIVTIKWTLSNTGTTIETTIKSGDGATVLGAMKILRSLRNDSCDSDSATCDMFTFTTPASPYITRYTYTADGLQKAFVTSLVGAFKGNHAGSFTLTNITVGDPQEGAKIIINMHPQLPPASMTAIPPDKADGSVVDKDGKTVATFTVDYKNVCTLVKFPGTPQQVTTQFPL